MIVNRLFDLLLALSLANLLTKIGEIPEPTTIWPTSVAGLVGLVAAFISLAVIIFDRLTGRANSWRDVIRDIKDLTRRVENVEEIDSSIGQSLRDIEDTLRDINNELKGPAGDNGIRQGLKDVKLDLKKITDRNNKMDLLAGLFKQAMQHENYPGPERRQAMRQIADLIDDPEPQ